MYLITPSDVEKEALHQGWDRGALEVPGLIFLAFNQAVVEELTDLSQMEEWEWPAARFSPAFSPMFKGWRGQIDDLEIAAFIPPMGASTLVSFCEELVHYGARVIFLLCASWSLGREYLAEGEVHLPSFAVGLDGTSPHYGNTAGRVDAEPRALKALAAALNGLKAAWKEGGVGTCEAFYRITPNMADDFREQGCVSVENGETAALFSLARARQVPIGVLLQPYIDLEQGWSPSYMGKRYTESGKLQVRAALQASRLVLADND